MVNQATALIQPAGTADASQGYVFEFDDDVHGDDTSFAPGVDIYSLFQARNGERFLSGVANDQVALVNKGLVTRRRFQAGLVLNNETRSINLAYLPIDTPSVVFFGATVSLDQGKLKNGIAMPLNYDGKQPVTFNVYFNSQFTQLKHSPMTPALVSAGAPWEEWEGDGDLSSWPVEYQVEYG